ncbi:MAG: hypothetical protein P8L44_07225, partial [Opitutales bacterium]|nr:hypothetical protein [Opitutales bacterium]
DQYFGHSAWLEYPWKLHRIVDGDSQHFELYNLESDPQERTNLLLDNSDRVRRMEDSLKAWQTSVMGSLNGKDY